MVEPQAPQAARILDAGDGKHPQYFDNIAIDNLMSVVLEIGAAIWVQRERLQVIERLLAQKGVVTTEMIETYQPSVAERADGKAERDAFINRLYGALARTPA